MSTTVRKQNAPLTLFAILILALSPFTTQAGEREDEIAEIEVEAENLAPVLGTGPGANYDYKTIDELFDLFALPYERDEELEELGRELIAKVYSDDLGEHDEVKRGGTYESIIFFVSYDFGTTATLGAGERAGAIASWRAAQLEVRDDNYIPGSERQWQDILKIANGRWPELIRRSDVEDRKYDEFRTIYQREPNRLDPSDDAAIMIMTYGLRPEPRNLDSETNAIGFFKGIYDRDPSSTADWDIVRAIAYSGATR